jgi:thioredoxin reductase
MRFPSHRISKEDLLGYWNGIRAQTGLKVHEKIRFDSLEVKAPQGFEVKTSAGIIKAQKVLLAMGVRGTPRRLGLANEDLPKVTYNLIDAEQYTNNFIVVVGGGNAGVEAACSLAKANLGNQVTIVIREAGFDRCHDDNQKIIFGLEKQGRIDIWFNSSVQKIEANTLTIKKGEQTLDLKNDYLFVFVGADVPFEFLMSLGVKIDHKRGQGSGPKKRIG